MKLVRVSYSRLALQQGFMCCNGEALDSWALQWELWACSRELLDDFWVFGHLGRCSGEDSRRSAEPRS